jgi:hypothetical protein
LDRPEEVPRQSFYGIRDPFEFRLEFIGQAHRAIVDERQVESVPVRKIAIESASRATRIACDFAHTRPGDTQIDKGLASAIENFGDREIRLVLAHPSARHYPVAFAVNGMEA